MTEDSQEADKAQLQGNIESLEKMLAQIEGEEVELRAMLMPATISTLQRSSSADSGGVGAWLGPGEPQEQLDITPYGVQQKLASLFKLRQQARELCGTDRCECMCV